MRKSFVQNVRTFNQLINYKVVCRQRPGYGRGRISQKQKPFTEIGLLDENRHEVMLAIMPGYGIDAPAASNCRDARPAGNDSSTKGDFDPKVKKHHDRGLRIPVTPIGRNSLQRQDLLNAQFGSVN